jgi:hypothetical protein
MIRISLYPGDPAVTDMNLKTTIGMTKPADGSQNFACHGLSPLDQRLFDVILIRKESKSQHKTNGEMG